MIYTAVAASSDELHRVTCAETPDGRGLTTFDQGPTFLWPAQGMFPRLAVSASRLLCVAKGHQGILAGGQLIVGNGQGVVRVLSKTHGNDCVAVEEVAPDLFRVACVVDVNIRRSWIVSGDLSRVDLESEYSDVNGAAEGWVNFVDGVPTWTHLARTVTLGGVQFWYPKTKCRWTIGLSGRANGIDGYDHASGIVFRVSDVDTPVQADLAALPDGSALVAISAKVPAFVASRYFDANWTPKLDGFPSTAQPIGIGIVDEATGPQWIGHDEPITPRTKLVFIDSRDWAAYLEAAQAKARAAGVPVGAYVDAPHYTETVPDGCRALVQAYLRPGESLPDFQARLHDELTKLNGAGIDLCVRAYTGNDAIAELDVRRAFRVVWALASEFQVGALWFFADNRRDGISAYPAFRQDIDMMRAASMDWRAFPKPSPVPEPPAEQDDDDMPKPLLPDHDRDEMLHALGESFALRYGGGNAANELRDMNSHLREKYGIDGSYDLLLSLTREMLTRRQTHWDNPNTTDADKQTREWQPEWQKTIEYAVRLRG